MNFKTNRIMNKGNKWKYFHTLCIYYNFCWTVSNGVLGISPGRTCSCTSIEFFFYSYTNVELKSRMSNKCKIKRTANQNDFTILVACSERIRTFFYRNWAQFHATTHQHHFEWFRMVYVKFAVNELMRMNGIRLKRFSNKSCWLFPFLVMNDFNWTNDQ